MIGRIALVSVKLRYVAYTVFLVVSIASFAAPFQSNLASIIDSYLAGRQSPMVGNGNVFFQEGVKWSVDPRLIVAISGQEQDFGKAPTSCNSVNNAWSWFYNGLRCPEAAFVSWAEGIQTVTEYIRLSYFDRYGATTIPAIGQIYCTELCGDWPENVTIFYRDHLGGDTSDLTFSAAQEDQLQFFGTQLVAPAEYVNGVLLPTSQWEFANRMQGAATMEVTIESDPNQPDIDPDPNTGTYRQGIVTVRIPELGLTASHNSTNMQISAFNNASAGNDQFFFATDGVDSFTSSVGLPFPTEASVLINGDLSMLSNDNLPSGALDWQNANVNFRFKAIDGTTRQVLIIFQRG